MYSLDNSFAFKEIKPKGLSREVGSNVSIFPLIQLHDVFITSEINIAPDPSSEIGDGQRRKRKFGHGNELT
jgi:hypothetical protein